MAEQWKFICKIKDLPQQGVRLVQRGFAWQELPGVALFRTVEDKVYALLDVRPENGAPRRYAVRIEEDRVYLDLNELNAPASRAEAALAGAYGMAPHAGDTPRL